MKERDSKAIERINNFQAGSIAWLIGIGGTAIALFLVVPWFVWAQYNNEIIPNLVIGCTTIVLLLFGVCAVVLSIYLGADYYKHNKY